MLGDQTRGGGSAFLEDVAGIGCNCPLEGGKAGLKRQHHGNHGWPTRFITPEHDDHNDGCDARQDREARHEARKRGFKANHDLPPIRMHHPLPRPRLSLLSANQLGFGGACGDDNLRGTHQLRTHAITRTLGCDNVTLGQVVGNFGNDFVEGRIKFPGGFNRCNA